MPKFISKQKNVDSIFGLPTFKDYERFYLFSAKQATKQTA